MKNGVVELDRASAFRTAKNTLLIVLGTFIIAFGTGIFLIPFDLVTGGVSGLGIVLNTFLRDVPFFSSISAATYASVANTLLFIVGLIFLGRRFALKTFVSALVYPIALSLAEMLIDGNVMNGFFNLASNRYFEYSEIGRMLATLLGGACVGCGVGLTFRGGGSSGGLDIICIMCCKYLKIRKLKSSHVLLVLDTLIITLGLVAIGDLVASLLGILSAFICSLTINKVFVSGSRAVIATIVSDKCNEINDTIIERLNRTSTLVNCIGGYTLTDKKMLICSFTMNQYSEFTAILDSIDRTAFVTFHHAYEINGEGWSFNVDKTEPKPERVVPKDE